MKPRITRITRMKGPIRVIRVIRGLISLQFVDAPHVAAQVAGAGRGRELFDLTGQPRRSASSATAAYDNPQQIRWTLERRRLYRLRMLARIVVVAVVLSFVSPGSVTDPLGALASWW